MTANRRIFLNIAATYGRSLYALVCGLFTVRWALKALGHADFGLYGLIGGLTAFIVFFNGLLSSAVGRFYAFAVGEASVALVEEQGVEECRRWFSVALAIHAVLPCLLVAVGYPVGAWAIGNFLSVPADRVGDCIWVWRLTCLSCFVGMLNVPFAAMYTAKQRIAELTVYSFAATTLNAAFLFYIVGHAGDWLVAYAAWMCAMSVLPEAVICVRAIMVFPECRFRVAYVLDRRRIGSLFRFAGMNFFGALAQMGSAQAMNIIVNRCLGPAKNATMSLALSVNAQASSLSGALMGAFHPAITNAAGAGDLGRMRSLAFRTCSLGTLLVAVFVLPLILEIGEVLSLWLVEPPEGAAELCRLYLVTCIIDRISDGHWIAVFATGRICGFRLAESIAFLSMPLVALALIFGGYGIASAGVALVVGRGLSACAKLWYGRAEAGMSISHWLHRVFLPLSAAMAVTVGVGLLPRLVLPTSFVRLVLTTGLCEAAFLTLAWFLVLDDADRRGLKGRVAFVWRSGES